MSQGELKEPLLRQFRKVLAATRLHFPGGVPSLPEQAKQKLCKYAVAIKRLGVPAAIAVSAHADEIRQVINDASPGVEIEVLHVPVWGAFVPALNALLGLAQQRNMKFILYHSLEVTCEPAVLEKMMDHAAAAGMLVVGPVLEGHTFESGEQTLTGRTTPWNTLALWSVRKLALTGFLNIADGLPARQLSGDSDQPDVTSIIGSLDWWIGGPEAEDGVPAGVEEVTAIALLQHLLGKKQARAVLLMLPEKLISWNTNWQGDAQRKKWHEYKMASKVARPAAQIAQLFKSAGRMKKVGSLSSMSSDSDSPDAPTAEPSARFGTVMHFGESIRAPPHVEYVCLIAIFLFSANFTSILASAFRTINETPIMHHMSLNVVMFVSLLIGGVFMPLPASVRLIKFIVSRSDDRAGVVLFSACMLIGNGLVMGCELSSRAHEGLARQIVLLVARFIEGLGSGVLFQARFMLASLSTEDHHYNLQKRQFIATDIGLGVGALLPAVMSFAVGETELSAKKPDFYTSTLLTTISCLYLFWVIFAFPNCLHPLPRSVRLADGSSQVRLSDEQESRVKKSLVISGTLRIFVQSALVFAVALTMKEMGVAGHFRQSFVVATVVLLPVPFEICTRTTKNNSLLICAAVVVLLFTFLLPVLMSTLLSAERMRPAILATVEFVVLIIVNATIAPRNVSQISQLSLPEHTMVVLEWSKAYIGRLCGPVFALVVHRYAGSVPLVVLLCAATVVVARLA